MSKIIRALLLVFLLPAAPPQAGADEPFDYFQANRLMIRNGVQAVLMCNGLFTSGRTLQQVFDQELAYLERVGGTVGTAAGGAYTVERETQSVAVGGGDVGTRIRAAFRQGLGCVVMAPDQGLADIGSLPKLELPPPPGDPAAIPWPDGDLVAHKPLPPAVDAAALQAASDWAFDRESQEQVTLSLIVLHGGDIVHERYAEGVDRHTRTRTWSTAKSIAVTLIGMLVAEGRLALEEPWVLTGCPRQPAPKTPRAARSPCATC